MKEEKVQMDEMVQSDSNSNDCYKQFEPHLNKINNNPMPSRKMEDDKELLLLMDESRDLSQNFHINYSPKRTRMKKHSVITMLRRVVVLIACSFSLFVNGQGGPPPPPSSPGVSHISITHLLPYLHLGCDVMWLHKQNVNYYHYYPPSFYVND